MDDAENILNYWQEIVDDSNNLLPDG